MQLYLLYLQIIPTFVPIKSNPIINKTSTAVMKKKTILFASCLFGVFAFSSCEKNLYDESKQPEKEKKMTDLEVPENFGWTDYQESKVKITTSKETTVYIYLAKDCNEKDLMLKMKVSTDTQILPLEIPAYIENVYVKYEGGSNVSVVPVNADGTISISVPAVNAKTLASRAITNYTENTNDNFFGYPSGDGYATVMFEDMYPSLGDYDFNDFAAHYRLQIPEFYWNIKKRQWVTDVMYIGFQVRAIGGIYDYDPYIRLTNVKYEDLDIESCEEASHSNFKITEGPKGEAIIFYKKPAIPEGQKYFNTELDQKNDPGKFPDALYLFFNSSISVDNLQNSKVDIYLAKKNHGQEIHLKGYHSVYGSAQEKYATDKNLVWGFKIPEAICHATEKTNFLQAYPDFDKWVMSNGTQYKQWWTNKVSTKLIINN